MATTTVRIDERTHATLRRLACELNAPLQHVLADAVEAFRRSWLLQQLDEHYTDLQADPSAWETELEEQRLWDAALADGLEKDPYPFEPDQCAALESALLLRAHGPVEPKDS